MKKRCIILFVLILISIFPLRIISQSLIDSLFLELANAENDTIKVNVLNQITREYRVSDANKALKYNKLAFELSEKLGYTSGTAFAKNLLGTIYRYKGRDMMSLSCYMDALELYEEINDSFKMADLNSYIGQIYDDLDDLDKALSYYDKSLKIFHKLNNDRGVAIIFNNMGVIYVQRNEDSLALKSYERALEINTKINRKIGMGYAYMNIGNIYERMNYNAIAKDYYFNSLECMIEAESNLGVIDVMYNIGNIYNNETSIDSAFYYLIQAKELALKNNYYSKIPQITLLISDLFYDLGDLDQSRTYLKDYVTVKDSLYNIRIEDEITELEKKFEFEKELEIQEFELLEKSRKLKINRLENYILLTVLVALFVIGAILINRKRINIKWYNEKLKTKNNELVSFAIYILQKNELIHTFRKQLLELQKKLKLGDNKKLVNDLINSLIFKIAISKDIDEFRDKLREISKEFYSKLEQKYPNLTEKEKQLATLLKLNLSSKQMAVILNISPESVDISRHRLRKKIELSADINLGDFFNQI